MDTSKLEKFAQLARRSLIEQVTAKLKLVMAVDSAARRESVKAIAKLEKETDSDLKKLQLIEKVAYTWFNRFCALRFMDVNHYTRIGIVSPLEGQSQPEILAEAKQGHVDEEIVSDQETRQQISALLSGKATSRDPQSEAFRLLIVAACNHFHYAMPFLFEAITDYTELLMPEDLLSDNSILSHTRKALTPDNCQDVEVIGWLYQYYISEKKDAVFDGLKKNKKITPENIPAATQLFTPHWIVRYLVENSLGRLWMLNRPQSQLCNQMEYFIKSDQQEANFLHISKPEEIRFCDPACGSGHILVYAFDLMYAIYEEEGYDPASIPELILKNNLYGIEIDERAGELASFALAMKARAKQKNFFKQPTQPLICVLEKIDLTIEHLKTAEWNILIDELIETGVNENSMIHDLTLFDEADNFGSLLRPQLSHADIEKLIAKTKGLEQTQLEDYFLIEKLLKALNQADYLSTKYHIVVANPPYMGGKGMNPRLSAWAKDNYPDSKSDFFAMFIERGFELVKPKGYSAMVTMQSWMFLSSYEKLRIRLLDQVTIECMAHMANMVMGIAFGTAATVWCNSFKQDYKGAFCYVEYEDIDKNNKPVSFPPLNSRNLAAKGL